MAYRSVCLYERQAVKDARDTYSLIISVNY